MSVLKYFMNISDMTVDGDKFGDFLLVVTGYVCGSQFVDAGIRQLSVRLLKVVNFVVILPFGRCNICIIIIVLFSIFKVCDKQA